MSRLKIALSIFAVSAFLVLVIGISQARAGVVPNVDCSGCPGGIACPGGGASCFGTAGNDIICGSATVDVIFAGKGSDIVCAGNGADVIHGGYGDDDLDGEGGADEIFGGWGEDLIQGGGSDDEIHGGRCADLIDGEGGYGDECHGGRGTEGASFDNCEQPIAGGDIGLEDGDAGGQCDAFQ